MIVKSIITQVSIKAAMAAGIKTAGEYTAWKKSIKEIK